MKISSWNDVKDRVRCIVDENAPHFDHSTIRQVEAFVAFARRTCRAPDEVQRGYLPTISVFWRKENLEIEIHSDHLEIYRAHPDRMDIRHVKHAPDVPYDELLLKVLAEVRI